MLRAIDEFRALFDERGIEIYTPNVVQILSEEELIELLPAFDGWIIGDDPATSRVFEAGKKGRLRAAVKWGVGVDNVDFDACRRLGIPISNTPGMFGQEVADIAMFYVIALARHAVTVDHGVKSGQWPKPAGVSLGGRTAGLVGFGDIGRNVAKRLLAADMKVNVYDPFYKAATGLEAVRPLNWPDEVSEADFLVVTCALTPGNRHMVNADVLARCKQGVRIVNVARGPLIDENALCDALESGKVRGAALEVFETEPLPADARIRNYSDQCLFGSHNSSNTIDAVRRTSLKAIELMHEFLK
jgi:D-3-phosphoglycerate dehydrogenase